MIDPPATKEERRALDRQLRQAKLRGHIEEVISKAPELSFFRSRVETENMNSALLKNLYVQMGTRPLTDLQVETAVKLVQKRAVEAGETFATTICPSGIQYVVGYVEDTYRQSNGVELFGSPNRPKIVVRDDRGFAVRLTCPQILIEQVGSLKKMAGWRIGFGIDLMPTRRDPTVGQKRPISQGGNGHIHNPILIGRQFEDPELNTV